VRAGGDRQFEARALWPNQEPVVHVEGARIGPPNRAHRVGECAEPVAQIFCRLVGISSIGASITTSVRPDRSEGGVEGVLESPPADAA
jgi:hypothetical protein